MEGKNKKPIVPEEEKPERAPDRIRGFRYRTLETEQEPKTEVEETK